MIILWKFVRIQQMSQSNQSNSMLVLNLLNTNTDLNLNQKPTHFDFMRYTKYAYAFRKKFRVKIER